MDLYDEESDSFTHYNIFPSPYVMALAELDSDTLLVGTWGGGVSVLNPRKQDYNFLSADGPEGPRIDQGKVNALLEDRQGNFWIGIYNKGINRVTPRSGAITRFTITLPLKRDRELK